MCVDRNERRWIEKVLAGIRGSDLQNTRYGIYNMTLLPNWPGFVPFQTLRYPMKGKLHKATSHM